MSPLTQGRGLKHIELAEEMRNNAVAPHTGAWIETLFIDTNIFFTSVAPHTGAWIETY